MTVNSTIARLAALAVAVGAGWGSVATLLAIAENAQLWPVVALPVCLDGMGIVAMMAIRRDIRDVTAWGMLVAATGVSTLLQWLHAPAGLEAHLTHAAPPVAMLITFHLFLRATAAVPSLPVTVPVVVPVPPIEVVATAAPTKVRAPRKAARPEPSNVDELVSVARKILADLDLSPHAVGRPRLATLMRTAGHPLGTKKADAVLAALRTEVPV